MGCEERCCSVVATVRARAHDSTYEPATASNRNNHSIHRKALSSGDAVAYRCLFHEERAAGTVHEYAAATCGAAIHDVHAPQREPSAIGHFYGAR